MQQVLCQTRWGISRDIFAFLMGFSLVCQRRRDDVPEKYFLCAINTSDPRSFIKGSENSAISQSGLRQFEEHLYSVFDFSIVCD